MAEQKSPTSISAYLIQVPLIHMTQNDSVLTPRLADLRTVSGRRGMAGCRSLLSEAFFRRFGVSSGCRGCTEDKDRLPSPPHIMGSPALLSDDF